MMKRIAVIASKKEYAEYLKNNVEKYLCRYAEFVSYSIPEMDAIDEIREDYVLISAFNIFQKVRAKIGEQTDIIVLNVSLSKQQMQKLDKIPGGERALLVNYDSRSCMHTITAMYDAGYRGVELIPYYGQGDYDHSIRIAITPNEEHLVPEGITTVFNIGESSVDLNSLFTIADRLGVLEEFSANEAQEARQEYYHVDSGMDRLMSDAASMSSKLDTMIRLMKDGIIITDSLGTIYVHNEKAEELLKGRTEVLTGFGIGEVLPDVDLDSEKETLIRLSSKNLIITPVRIMNGDEMAGYIITVTDFDEQEDKQHGMRNRVSGADFVARYHFDDIQGNSPEIRDAIRAARKMGRSSASVLITGESGTGKEMFAQSIHNESDRSRYNFVAVNCSAIPENLLESEMFGYEGGSFTGAQKGGKAGYFELAHKGTIFLDEIGEMPMALQAKLLRVLEEKQIMRVGSNKVIDIDVRVIAATNENLPEMMRNGMFREDLYYRLNVLPLHIPPLRERKEDIIPIFENMIASINPAVSIDEDTREMLAKHGWNGNVRELRNVAEYLASQGKLHITAEDLPPLMVRNPELLGETTPQSSTIITKFILHEGRDIELYDAILQELKVSLGQGNRAGRRSLVGRINDSGSLYSEGEVRRALSKLAAYGFIRAGRGRGGSVITSDGLSLLNTIESLRENGILG